MKPPIRFALAVLAVCLLQTAALAYMVLGRAAILRDGQEVMLRTAPVDPRDLLRGDYVIMGYEVSTVPAAAFTGEMPKARGRERLWVRLAPGEDGISAIREAAYAPLPPEPGTVVMRSLPFDYWPSDSPQDRRADYGIERYYVPEGEGRRLEDMRDQQALTVAVRVAADGTAQLRGLYADGALVYEEPLF